MMRKPVVASTQNGDTFAMIRPFLTMPIKSTPSIVPAIVPTPPKILPPPISTAAMTSNDRLLPAVDACTLPTLAAKITEAIPTSIPVST
ncbi:hypothetical protein D3C75_1237380 [compost metagenome]